MEVLDERWTLLVIRELVLGSRHFNELRRGVPRMSPALLSKRLRSLVRAGVVERREDGSRVAYLLTPAGKELAPIVDGLGRWGTRWIPELGDEDLDPHLLMWDVHRNLARDAIPDRRTVLLFAFREPSVASRTWWLVVTPDEADICDADPGYPVDATVETELRAFTHFWRGDLDWPDLLAAGMDVHGPAHLRRELPGWFARPFAAVPRPA
jgi:DNA-binding HxlR family transcriptional regulator